MKISKKRILELGIILKEEYNVTLSSSDLEALAYSIIGYSGLLINISNKKFETIQTALLTKKAK